MSVEAIQKALDVDMSKGITTVDRLRIIAGGVPDFDPITVEDAEWIISALESLQRENEELRQDRDRTARNRDMYKGQVERQADNLSWYRSGSFANAVNEHLADAGISINGDILHDCIRRTALASTGGEHHGN